jgi:hypothetical protein
MLIIALSARPWILAMKQQSVIPRVLADDIMVIADSHQASDCENHIDKFVSASNFTLQYFQDFRARIALKRSYTFSSQASARCTLKSFFWAPVAATIPLQVHERDLGANLPTSSTLVGATITSRLDNATNVVQQTSRLPLSNVATTTKLLHMGLYGFEVQPCNDGPLAKFRTAISRAIGFKSNRKSIELPMAFKSADGTDRDPIA